MATVQVSLGKLSLQSGASDLVSAYTIATGIGGWVGGLEGFQAWRQACAQWLSLKSLSSDIAQLHTVLPSLEVAILTNGGLKLFEDDNGNNAFGGDPVGQWLGANLCALAYVCGAHAAVDLLIESMVPNVFRDIGEAPVLKDSLHKILSDHLSQILNEGAARQLTAKFMEATANLPNGEQRYMREKLSGAGKDDRKVQTEIDFVAGFLWWLTSDGSDPYLTRSGMVMKVAACLKILGCWNDLASGKTWDGQGQAPPTGRAPILVLGGAEKASNIETDKYLFPPGVISPNSIAVYYRLSAVGAAFVNSFHHFSDVRAEECQNHWNRTRKFVHKSFTPIWRASSVNGTNEVEAHFGRLQKDQCDNAFAVTLASTYFAGASMILGHCFEDIATSQETVDCVQKSVDAIGGYDTLPRPLQLFRIVSACIILAFVELLAGPEFETLRHVTTLDLDSPDFLEELAKTLNDGLSGRLPFWQAASLVSALHAGTDGEAVEALRQRHRPAHRVATLGRRAGIFGVIPRLLANMDASEESVGLACFDNFIANVPCDENGWILDGTPQKPTFELSNESVEVGIPEPAEAALSMDIERQDPGIARASGVKPFVGSPAAGGPDLPLYLGIERPRHYGARHVLLSGRHNGTIIAQVSVRDVMRVLSRSIDVAAITCPGHDQEPQINVLNTTTSQWIEREFMHHARWNIFLQTQCDSAWTLFAAGQAAHYGGMIVFNCPQCVRLAISRTSASLPSAMIDFRRAA